MGAACGCCSKDGEREDDNDLPKWNRRHKRRKSHRIRQPSPYRTEEAMAFSLLREGKVCVATFAYEPGSPAEVKLAKGDRVELMAKESEDFVFVRQLKKDGLRGYVATNFLAPEFTVEAEDYYFGPMKRRESVNILRNEDLPGGAFLVRDSETSRGKKYEKQPGASDIITRYVLSVKDCGKPSNMHHYRIYASAKQPLYYIVDRVKYDRIPDLIAHYQRTDAPSEVCCKLTYAMSRPPPIRKALSKEMRDKWREIPRDQVEVLEELGSGNFGAVHRGAWKTPGGGNPIEVAVKRLKEVTPKAREMLFAEAFAMRDLCHKNIVRLYGVITSGEPYCMVAELMKNGSLKNYLQQRHLNRESPVPDVELVDIATQVCRGMAYVESKNIIHRDLAARNILINILSHKPIKIEAKITDFGLARILHDKGVYTMGRDTPMPRQWMSPEAFNKNKFTTKSDVWAYGATLCELFGEGEDPFRNVTPTQLLKFVERGVRPKVPPAMHRCGIEYLFRMCTRYRPEERPTFSDLQTELETMLSGSEDPD